MTVKGSCFPEIKGSFSSKKSLFVRTTQQPLAHLHVLVFLTYFACPAGTHMWPLQVYSRYDSSA